MSKRYAGRTQLASNMALRFIGITILTSLAFVVPAEVLAQDVAHPGQYLQDDVRMGGALYERACVMCHGANGDGVGSVDLRKGQFRKAVSDEELMALLKNGLPGTGMPAFGNLTSAELTSLVAFIRAGFDRNATGIKVGDAARGRELFEGKGNCSSCHSVNGRGPRAAPDLSDVGASRDLRSLQGVILDPTAFLVPIHRPVRAVTRDGKVITGRRLNEDTYTVQLINEREQLLSLQKADLRAYEIGKTAMMPSYKGKLSESEVADLVAYLSSLRN